ncbi:MAG TPA: hypothetical protein VF621_13255 [Pyrinomonadaceae bacterium]
MRARHEATALAFVPIFALAPAAYAAAGARMRVAALAADSMSRYFAAN